MRPAEVFVRELSLSEAERLKRQSRRAKHQSTWIRAMILLASATEMSAPDIARLYRTDESYVRKVIHAFNEEGFDSLRPRYRGGRPKKTTPAERDRVVAIARARPDTQGVALTRWSLPQLAAQLERELGLYLCPETLRALLSDAGLSHQRTRSWKWSPDPDFRQKAERVLALYRSPPKDGPVVCFDEMGPIGLIPHHATFLEGPLASHNRARSVKPSSRQALQSAQAVPDEARCGPPRASPINRTPLGCQQGLTVL